jgi:outer membrane protein assembly factor BamB
MNYIVTVLVLLCGMAAPMLAADAPLGHKDFVPTPEHPVGWRGDGTGVFPGATPPTQWSGPAGRNAVMKGGKVVKVDVPLVWDGPETKNILWQVPMPHQTLASPIVVKGKVITLADPHTILAYDADTGKRLWHNAQDTFDLMARDPAEAKKLRRLYDLYHRHFSVDREYEKTWTTKDATSGIDLPAEKEIALRELKAAGIDPTATTKKLNHTNQHPFFAKYGLCAFVDVALASTMSTPVSDGTWVWVLWSSTRTVACYDVQTGKCRWMRWMGPHAGGVPGFNYNSPLLADGVLVVRHEDKLSGLDPQTGKDIWVVEAGGTRARPAVFAAANYSCETPVLATVGAKKVVLMYSTAAVDVKTGETVVPGAAWPKESCSTGGPCIFGSSPFLGGPDIVVQLPGKYGDMAARKFSEKGVQPMLWGGVLDETDGYVNEDTGQSLAHGGYVYLNDSGTSALIEIAAGKLIPRGIAGPNGGYPGCNIAGQHFFNFDGAASCTVTTLGPQGKLVSINHLIPGYGHTKRLTSAQGHGMKNPKGFTREWWKQAFAAREEGVVGWVGRTDTLAAGEMSAGPFFQGDRIYLRTHAELICIGSK